MGALRHERWCRARVAAAALAPPPPCRGRRAPEPTPPDTRPGWGAPEPGAGGGGTLADLLDEVWDFLRYDGTVPLDEPALVDWVLAAVSHRAPPPTDQPHAPEVVAAACRDVLDAWDAERRRRRPPIPLTRPRVPTAPRGASLALGRPRTAIGGSRVAPLLERRTPARDGDRGPSGWAGDGG